MLYINSQKYFIGSIGGQLLNGAEAGGTTGDTSVTNSNNVGNTICDNNSTTNNHTNNRTATGQNTPDGNEKKYNETFCCL